MRSLLLSKGRFESQCNLVSGRYSAFATLKLCDGVFVDTCQACQLTHVDTLLLPLDSEVKAELFKLTYIEDIERLQMLQAILEISVIVGIYPYRL